jgi:hypothetical protein
VGKDPVPHQAQNPAQQDARGHHGRGTGGPSLPFRQGIWGGGRVERGD